MDPYNKFSEWLLKKMNNLYIPLFEHDTTLNVKVREKRLRNGKIIKLISRSNEMENHLIETVKLVTSPNIYENDFEGIIYYVFNLHENKIFLNYIGITKKIGRTENKLNFNLKNIETERNHFARWGDDNARHIGGLSNAIFRNYEKVEKKYIIWAESLFYIQFNEIFLKEPTYFFAHPWKPSDKDYMTRIVNLEKLEYFIIKEIGPKINTKQNKHKFNKNLDNLLW